MSILSDERLKFHQGLRDTGLLSISPTGIPSMSDKDNKVSMAVGLRLLEELAPYETRPRLKGQPAGSSFESEVRKFLTAVFPHLTSLRCGSFHIERGRRIYHYDQYKHLKELEKLAERSSDEARELRLALGSHYLVKPDVVILRKPESDADLVVGGVPLVDANVGKRSSIRASTGALPTLHASISCKWTMRSDRAQNSRSEALNLIRNRKGRLPHIVVVTGEADPAIIASLAQGTADLDCVYHVALDELLAAVDASGFDRARDALRDMVGGHRLRDVADLPLDLTV